MEPTTVVQRPIITERATYASAELNRYTFEVDKRASKDQIKRAVEQLYKVRVLGVATQTRQGKTRRYRYGLISTAPTKRAIVKVHPEDRIELF
jgi:large subunit ribosomal protein L23